MDEYRIPTERIPIRILLDDGRVLDGDMFAPPEGPGRRAEAVLARLNDAAEDFLPVASAEDRFLVNKAGIIWAQVATPPGEVGAPDGGIGREVPVRVTLAGGTSLLGRVRIVMPPERCRVLDYLNAAPRFLPLLGEGVVTLVQRGFIVTVFSAAPSAH